MVPRTLGSVHTRSEEALWAAARSGDGDAFGVLFDRHHPRVHHHATRLLPTRADAEDVTASAFLEAWRRREHVRLSGGSVLPWLLVTTTNLARNNHRGTRRYRDFLARLPREGSVPDTAETALAGALGVDERLNAALATLRPLDQQLITLIALEDVALTDAATLLGLTPAAAKTRMHRARTRLRAALGDHPGTAHLLPAAEGQHS